MFKSYIIIIVLLSGILIANTTCCLKKCPKFKAITSTENSAEPKINGSLRSKTCVRSRYRSMDGSCNNLKNPMWGAADTPYARILPAKYGDGVSSFAKSVKGCSLPNARKLRFYLFPDKIVENMDYTLITMQWGQIVAHDMSLTSGVPQTRAVNLTCCDATGNFNENARTDPRCAPISIFKNDPIYGPINKVCMDFIRTNAAKIECAGAHKPVQQLSAVTAYIDLSIVYGNNKTQNRLVREMFCGRLKSVRRGGQEWPPQDPEPELTCDVLETPKSPCYFAGDVRVNQNIQLTLLQVMLLREHNRIADVLCKINPNWSDEVIFQEARRILIAICQHITYYHYLPIILGYENMYKNKLIYRNVSTYVSDYDPNVDASVYTEHATSAFRHFHTNIQGHLKKYSSSRNLVGDIRLSDNINNPTQLERDDGFDALARGLVEQFEAETDKYYDEEISERIFKAGNEYGDDLPTIDLHRSRDHGLPSYINMRAALGLSVPMTFEDMEEYIPPGDVQKLKGMYASIEDIDLFVGGAMENKIPDTKLGPTFLTITTRQFSKTRRGDRFFFENGKDPKIAFTSRQLKSIREGGSMARLFCNNVPGIQSVQLDVFRKTSDENPIVSCAELPLVDLMLWKEKC